MGWSARRATALWAGWSAWDGMDTGRRSYFQGRGAHSLQRSHAQAHTLSAAHLSTSTVRATSYGFHVAGAASLSTPLAGPTVMLTLTKSLRSSSSLTMRCRASAVSGAAPGEGVEGRRGGGEG